MKKKYLAYALLPFLGLGLFGATIASAHGPRGFGFPSVSPEDPATRQEARFEAEANLLGVSVDVIKQGWANGKTLQDVATAEGITADQLHQRVVTAGQDRMKANLQALVDKKIITQAQADTRLQFMQSRTAKTPQNGKMFHEHGHRGGRGL